MPALSQQPSGNVVTKEVLGGTNAVVSRRCWLDSTPHKTQTGILPLSSALGMYQLSFQSQIFKGESSLFFPVLAKAELKCEQKKAHETKKMILS